MAVAASELSGQPATRTEFALAGGVAVRRADARAIGGDVAIDVRLHVSRWWSSGQTLGARAGLGLDFFPVQAEAIPSCAPPGVCASERSLSAIWSLDAEAIARRSAQSHFNLTAGTGLYAGSTGASRGTEGYRSPQALGVGAGIEGVTRTDRLGLGIRTRYFPTGLGEIRWLTTATVLVKL